MDEFIAIIKLFAGNFAPKGWAFCDGRLMAINTNQALFSLLGTTYGGDGVNTFGLPDLRSRVPIGTVQAQGNLGQIAGTQTVTLVPGNLPIHTHSMMAIAQNGNISAPAAGAALGAPVSTDGSVEYDEYIHNLLPDTVLNNSTVGSAGNNYPHNNMQPYLGLNYIICLSGLYPPRQ